MPLSRTVLLRLASNAIATVSQPAAGPASAPLFVQFVPSQVYVCVSLAPLAGMPPNMITYLFAESNTMRAPARAVGLVAGLSSVQFVPSYVHVSLSGIVPSYKLAPPNMTIL